LGGFGKEENEKNRRERKGERSEKRVKKGRDQNPNFKKKNSNYKTK
jgi:hypothetical protein